MPISKFKCHECGKEFAKIFVDAKNAPQQCPVCGASEPEEMGPAFHVDKKQIERLSCTSCEGCAEEASVGICCPSS